MGARRTRRGPRSRETTRPGRGGTAAAAVGRCGSGWSAVGWAARQMPRCCRSARSPHRPAAISCRRFSRGIEGDRQHTSTTVRFTVGTGQVAPLKFEALRNTVLDSNLDSGSGGSAALPPTGRRAPAAVRAPAVLFRCISLTFHCVSLHFHSLSLPSVDLPLSFVDFRRLSLPPVDLPVATFRWPSTLRFPAFPLPPTAVR